MNKKLLFLSLLSSLVVAAITIDLNNPDNYASQTIPPYIQKDNTTPQNPITDKGATLGRVLFYDKNLSVNNTIACASCHKQEFAFSDTATQSLGLTGGRTGRHSMRLVNARFSTETKFFWDERATSLEDQTTRPIQDHVEMGFSGANGDPDLDSLFRKLTKISYYKRLFTHVYGDTVINETRVQNALAQFIRSIQSFDSKFDAGRAQVNNINANFPNFTTEENQGKTLFLDPPQQGGAGCQGCHRAPEFDIDPASLNNGVVAVAGGGGAIDLTNTRAPSLRNLFNNNGVLNGPLMHNGNFTDIATVINHYNLIPINVNNTNLDQRLQGPGGNLQLTQGEKDALAAFLKTLSGSNVYTDPKWSNPFDANGDLTLLPQLTGLGFVNNVQFTVFPNPVIDNIQINILPGKYQLKVYDINGKTLVQKEISQSHQESTATYVKGTYLFEVTDVATGKTAVKKVMKN